MKKFVKLSKVKQSSQLRAEEMNNVKGGRTSEVIDPGEPICYGVPIDEPDPWEPIWT